VNERILVFNCHEAWVYQLGLLGRPMDIVVGLAGRHIREWDSRIRPLPPNARLVDLRRALNSDSSYSCVVAHNLTDLLDAKNLDAPKLLVLHLTLEGIIREQQSMTDLTTFRAAVSRYIRCTGVHPVAVSRLKGTSWGFTDDIVPLSADPAAYPEFQGGEARGLRVSNFISRRAHTLLWDFHLQVFEGLPMKLIGDNPEIPGTQPSPDWTTLRHTFHRHRFFVHTAHPELEDGYNMATLEAMAAGLPVLSNHHPSSPIVHGVSGFLSDDPNQLRAFAVQLLESPRLAVEMGRAARQTIEDGFSPALFRSRFSRSISLAQNLWASSRIRNTSLPLDFVSSNLSAPQI
jgi:hypothetical protein